MHFVCVLVLFIVVTSISAFPEREVRTYNLKEDESQSTFSALHGSYPHLKSSTRHKYRRGSWSKRDRQHRSHAASGRNYSQAWRSIFKNGRDYYNGGTVLVVSTDGTAQYTNIQDAIDQVPEFNTKRVTIYITGGIYE